MIIMFKPLNFFYARREAKMYFKVLKILILLLELINELLKLINQNHS